MKVMPSKCCNLKLNYDAFMCKYVLNILLIQNFQVNTVLIGRLGEEGYSTKGKSARQIEVPFLQDCPKLGKDCISRVFSTQENLEMEIRTIL